MTKTTCDICGRDCPGGHPNWLAHVLDSFFKKGGINLLVEGRALDDGALDDVCSKCERELLEGIASLLRSKQRTTAAVQDA